MNTIFFDLDDTLYFRRDAFYQAFEEFFDIENFCGCDYQDLMKEACDRCRIRGDEVFYQCQRGELSTDEMYLYRFQKGFGDVGLYITVEEALTFRVVYQRKLYALKLNDDVIQMLDFARDNFLKLGIITNGPGDHQRNKIKNLGLDKWIDPELIIVSGEHKCDKPDSKLFSIAQDKCGSSPDEILIIGDSLNNDILPATTLGWHTLWIDLYNENFKAPEYSVKSVNEIIPVLKNNL